ncbi:lipopolysaccharide biosynthesis protein [Chitinophaga sp. GCM10012297]|uniref:Chain length determinant protein n=1 Tax=Chitinophaga chungangae TaxID=2821488 RepID=A0ABS3YF05_9BACT|nr:hypothetical protein [Chitinophaga chungangae]MBO9153253.1 hypothetical protein [Chitinophaga chungangae]
MEQTTLPPHNKDEELSIKELILKIRSWVRYFSGKWKIITVLGLLGGALGFLYASFQKTQYLAELTFILEDNSSNPLGSYSGIASQFGVDLGGASSSNGLFTEDNILEFLKSRLMIERTLLSTAVSNGKKISLADFYIEMTGARKKWEQKKNLKDVSFPLNANRADFSLMQDSILNVIYSNIVEKNLEVGKLDKKLSFIEVKCTSPNEKFSKAFIERLVKEATEFYVQTKTKRHKSNVDRLQEKADSVERLLNQKTYSVAATQDLNLNPARSVAGVNLEVGTRDKLVLQTMYGEVIKNLEISKMAMLQETPIIQIIDTPILPLEKVKVSRLKSLILGGMIAGFLIILFLFVKKLYNESMR